MYGLLPNQLNSLQNQLGDSCGYTDSKSARRSGLGISICLYETQSMKKIKGESLPQEVAQYCHGLLQATATWWGSLITEGETVGQSESYRETDRQIDRQLSYPI